MLATGIVRRIDDIGRVVIPKEIRRTMNIKEGDPLEIYIDKQTKSVCFQKYIPSTSSKLFDNIGLIESNFDDMYFESSEEKQQAINLLKEIKEATKKISEYF